MRSVNLPTTLETTNSELFSELLIHMFKGKFTQKTDWHLQFKLPLHELFVNIHLTKKKKASQKVVIQGETDKYKNLVNGLKELNKVANSASIWL